MKIGVLTRDRYEGKPGTLGSSLIRGDWLVSCDPEHFEYYNEGEQYSCVIDQKVYVTPPFSGHKVILDVVDPDWHDDRCGTFRNNICPAISFANAVTVPTEVMAKTIRSEFDGVNPIVVPDRTWLPYFDGVDKKMTDEFKTVGWFGYAENIPVMEQMLPTIKEIGLKLVVISNENPRLGCKFINYNRATVSQDLIDNCDVLINPRLNTPFFQHKSDSKTQWGAACGLPVAHTAGELRSFTDRAKRIFTLDSQVRDLITHKRMEDSCRQFIQLSESIACVIS